MMIITTRHLRLAIVIQLLASGPFSMAQDGPDAEQLIRDLGCSNCHSGIAIESNVREKAPDLSDAGVRYNPSYLFSYLQAPNQVRNDIGLSRMPDFHIKPEESLALTLYLQTLVPAGTEKPEFMLDQRYRDARTAFPKVDAATGLRIFSALNCQACHLQTNGPAKVQNHAPDLGHIGSRVRESWLTGYLAEPNPVRPFGYLPGTGGRMPNFKLSSVETAVLTGYLMKLTGTDQEAETTFNPTRLSPFSMAKSKALMRTKLSCLGCHQLGGEGGRIGPDLSGLKNRLKAGYVYRIIQDPGQVLGETIMPKTAMTPARLQLITNYLLQQEEPRSDATNLSLVENEPMPLPLTDSPRTLYERYCSQCHGKTGAGDGYNAKFLPAMPTQHSDAAAMADRPDDTLFDGIHAGGYILNKSNTMPSWGHSLTPDQIKQLVAYIRQLCNCEGPSWSRDN